eukprot:194695-Pleurochrysis_carterae.AAC.2
MSLDIIDNSVGVYVHCYHSSASSTFSFEFAHIKAFDFAVRSVNRTGCSSLWDSELQSSEMARVPCRHMSFCNKSLQFWKHLLIWNDFKWHIKLILFVTASILALKFGCRHPCLLCWWSLVGVKLVTAATAVVLVPYGPSGRNSVLTPEAAPPKMGASAHVVSSYLID